MEILLINHYAGSPEYGMEYRPFYFAREWRKLGHTVRVVGASYSHLRRKNPAVRRERLEGVEFVWLPTPSYNGNGVRRALNILAFVAQLYRYRRELGRPALVIASSTHPLDIFPAQWIAKAASARLIFEVHDLWPLAPIELGGVSRFHPFMMLMQYAEDFALRRADRVISILPQTLPYMQARGLSPERWSHVPNGVDPEILQEDSEVSGEYLNLVTSGQFIVAYAGAHGIANGLEQLLDAAAELQNENVAFVLIGGGPLKPSLMKSAGKNVHFLPPLSRGSLLKLLQRASALILCLKPSPIFRFGISPNKLFDYMLCAVPIIHAVPGAVSIVDEAQCGISCANHDIASAIRQLMRMSQSERDAMGQRGKEYVIANHSYAPLAQEFLKAAMA